MTFKDLGHRPNWVKTPRFLGIGALAVSIGLALWALVPPAYKYLDHHHDARLAIAVCGAIIGLLLVIVGVGHEKDLAERKHKSDPGPRREPGYPRPLERAAGRVKAALQMGVGLYALGWLGWSFYFSHRLHNCAPLPPTHGDVRNFTGDHLCYLIPQSAVVFQVVADALAAATVIQLAYTLFTPGPDEALDPVLLALATVFLFEIGQINQFQWQDGVTILLYAAGLGLLFAVRVFLAPDEDNPPTLWWWRRRPYRWRPPARPR
ncbi:MAG TPA: hypothetical protein VH480_11870 [Streptosporangiaceae bacterium]|jgi:hypothetical protein